MFVAGAAGSLFDLAYGWNVACDKEVAMWRRHQEQVEQEKEHEQNGG
jgi:hypothetical protein